MKECTDVMEKLAHATALSIEEINSTKVSLMKLIEEVSELAIIQIKELEAARIRYLETTAKQNMELKKVICFSLLILFYLFIYYLFYLNFYL